MISLCVRPSYEVYVGQEGKLMLYAARRVSGSATAVIRVDAGGGRRNRREAFLQNS